MDFLILTTFKGKEAGQPVKQYLAGSTYFIECADLQKTILEQNWGIANVGTASVPDETPLVEQIEQYGLAPHEIALLPVKKLKAIIEEEALTVDTQGKKQAEIADAVVAQLQLKYKGL